MANKKMGEFGYWDVFYDEDGDIAFSRDYDDAYADVFYLSIKGVRTIEDTLAGLRAAATDPREAVIAAARRFVANEFLDDHLALVKAVERLEDSECDDDEETDADD